MSRINKISFEKIASGAYRLIVNSEDVARVERVRWTSGMATEWKVWSISPPYSARGFDSRQFAAETFINDTSAVCTCKEPTISEKSFCTKCGKDMYLT